MFASLTLFCHGPREPRCIRFAPLKHRAEVYLARMQQRVDLTAGLPWLLDA